MSRQPGIDRFVLNPNGLMEMRKFIKQRVEAVEKYQRSQLQVLQVLISRTRPARRTEYYGPKSGTKISGV